jgi:hypothetical protein
MKQRIDAVIVQAVIVTYNDQGEPVKEDTSQVLKLFRASTPAIWEHFDELLAGTAKNVPTTIE